MNTLFTPYRLGNLDLRNRVIMAPMTRNRATNNLPNALMAEYYTQRSEAGLIIAEGTSPSPNGLGYSRTPGIYTMEQIKGWRKITDAVHDRGGKIFLQLMHTGRVGHMGNLPTGATLLSPSAVALENTSIQVDGRGNLKATASKAMTMTDVQLTIEEHVQAARNAVEAGFDGVEILAANGYLIDQFLNPHTNLRTDEYGGSVESRAKFLLDIAQGVAQAIGAERTGVRISPYNTSNEMPQYAETDATYDYVSKALNALEIAYLHVVTETLPPGLRNTLRRNFDNAVIFAGEYNRETANLALAEEPDLIAFGRPFVANPDLVDRLRKRLPYNQLKFDLFYSAGSGGYTDYPVFEDAMVLI